MLQFLWGFYLLRSPLFEALLKPGLDKVPQPLHLAPQHILWPRTPLLTRLAPWQSTFVASYVPLIGTLAGFLRDLVLYFQRHYFYTAASS